MGVACEVWMNESERMIGKFEFDTVPRSGETISLPNDSGQQFTHYCVEHVTHRAHGSRERCATFLFVASAQKGR